MTILQTLCFLSCEPKQAVKTAAKNKVEDPIASEILAVEKMRLDALNQFDSLRVKQLLAPEFEMTTAKGELLNTQQLLQILKKRSQAQVQEKHYTKHTKVKLLSSNNVVLARGIYVIERRETRGLTVLTLRFTDLYTKKSENNWLLESTHISRISR